VRNLPDIFFLPEWGQAFQELDKGEVVVFEHRSTNGHIYYQFIKRKIPDFLGHDFFDIITPYGFSGPVIVEEKAESRSKLLQEFTETFAKFCINERIISEYVRFNPWIKNHLDFEKIYNLKYNNYTVHTDLSVKDFFNDEFSKKARNRIRHAEKEGIITEYDFTGASLNEFLRLYRTTSEKNTISEYYRFSLKFLEYVFKLLKDNIFIINARYENKYISSTIVLEYGDYLHSFLTGNDYEYYNLNAHSLVLYEIAKYGKENGKKQMHLGGAFSDQLFHFKKQFTKKGFCDFYVGKRIINERVYKDLVEKRIRMGNLKDSSYFPLYRG